MTYVKHELYKIRNTKFGYEWKIMTLERQKKKKPSWCYRKYSGLIF